MKSNGIFLTAIVLGLGITLALAPAAHAQNRIGNGAILKRIAERGAAANVGRRLAEGGARSAIRGAARNAARSQALSRSSRMGRSAGLSRSSNRPILDALRNGARHNSGNTPILDALRDGRYGNGYRGHDLGDYLRDRYDDRHGYRHDGGDYADAYRDVGIANAVVSLVGILANTATQQQPRYAAPQPVARYETHKVLVKEGHYVQEKVWVPEIFDPRTGRQSGGGYYETRSRFVPPVYEERTVLIER